MTVSDASILTFVDWAEDSASRAARITLEDDCSADAAAITRAIIALAYATLATIPNPTS